MARDACDRQDANLISRRGLIKTVGAAAGAVAPPRRGPGAERTGRTAEHGDDTAARLRPQRAAERLLH